MYILNNKHEYVKPEHTLQLLQSCLKVKLMNYCEALCIQLLLIEEQKPNDANPL